MIKATYIFAVRTLMYTKHSYSLLIGCMYFFGHQLCPFNSRLVTVLLPVMNHILWPNSLKTSLNSVKFIKGTSHTNILMILFRYKIYISKKRLP